MIINGLKLDICEVVLMIYAYNHVLLMFMMFHDVWKNSGLIEEKYSKFQFEEN